MKQASPASATPWPVPSVRDMTAPGSGLPCRSWLPSAPEPRWTRRIPEHAIMSGFPGSDQWQQIGIFFRHLGILEDMSHPFYGEAGYISEMGFVAQYQPFDRLSVGSRGGVAGQLQSAAGFYLFLRGYFYSGGWTAGNAKTPPPRPSLIEAPPLFRASLSPGPAHDYGCS